jgi:hypothetical protein
MSDEHDAEIITRYVEEQAHEKVVHVERASTAMVGPVRHDIWDVHCAKSRWWVVTNPTNLYTQEDFKSRDVVLTFHVGLALRMMYMRERDVPVSPLASAPPCRPWTLEAAAWRGRQRPSHTRARFSFVAAWAQSAESSPLGAESTRMRSPSIGRGRLSGC